ncbi:MAG: Na+/H+ antiporter NhaC family protein, partial [Clostridia bacterium]|nr:Na+/H+ antiporter NhaC family protein [Clostridia bacterium]
HVNTQLPYAGLVAGIAAVAYIIGGLCAALGSVLCCVILWVAALALFAGAVIVIKTMNKKKA